MKKQNIDTILFVTLIVLIGFKPRWTSNNIAFFGTVIWNTGYSNFLTKVEANQCLHIDPGGTLIFPKKIFKLCNEKQNFKIILHEDRFHTNYQKHLAKLKIKSIIHNSILQKYPSYFINNLATFGHLNQNGMDYYFNSTQRLIRTKYLILPNHGQPQFLSPKRINSFRRFKMIITGSQSRSYSAHHKTQSKFKAESIPIINKNIWGHLVLEHR